jgi:ABC-type Fe3+-hydroxamate transport system substrate-binding protein
MHRLLALAVLAALTAATPNSPRIVALVPSLAEDAFALGAHVVAVSEFVDNEPQARELPRVADFQSVDTERIVALHPDAVVGIPAQARLVEPLRRAGVRVVLVPDDTYDDIFTGIRAVGDLAARQSESAALIARLRSETASLRAQARSGPRPRVFVALGTGPIWTAGPTSFLATLIAFAGGTDAASDLRQPWGQYSEEALVRADPDAIIAGHDTQLRDVLDREPWRSLRAVREGHVFLIADPRVNDALFRPGPHYNEGLRWLLQRFSSLSTPKTPGARSSPSFSNSRP